MRCPEHRTSDSQSNGPRCAPPLPTMAIARGVPSEATTGKENGRRHQACPGRRTYLSCCQSPMAAYFGESDGTSMTTSSVDESPLANVTNLKDDGFSTGMSPKAEDLDGSCSTRSSRICSVSGLPFKSPMSAYFDGDGVDSFHLSDHPECNSIASPMVAPSMLVSPLVVAPMLLSPIVLTCQSQSFEVSLPTPLEVAPCPAKSALRTTPNSRGLSVAWAEEDNEKASLTLVEPLKVPALSSCTFAHHVWKLSQDAQGTFEVQKAFDECSSYEEREALASELKGHVYEATQCPHANHVLRKIITSMPAAALHFIVVELMSKGPGAISDLARHRYGCRILEGLIIHCPLEQLLGMVECLLVEAAAHCMHMYGNFVMQRLFEYHSSSPLRFQLFDVVYDNLTTIGTNFYGSAVLAKAMKHGSSEEKLLLARGMLNVGGLLAAIARYRHGKSIVALVEATLDDREKDTALRELNAQPLKASKNGRH